VGEGDQPRVGERVVVAGAAERRDARNRRLDQRVDAVRGKPGRPRGGVGGPPLLQRCELRRRELAFFGRLDPLTERGPVELPPVVESAVIRAELREQELEVRLAEVELQLGRRRCILHTTCEDPLEAACNGSVDLFQRGARRERKPKLRERFRWGGLATGHHCEQGGAVGRRARHRPRVVERRPERHDPVERHEAARRLDRAGATEGRRDPERAGGVGAGRRRDHSRGEGRGRPTARAARRTVELQRVGDLVGRAADRELVRVQVPEQHHPASLEPLPDGARPRRALVEQPARGGQRLPSGRVEVLEADRDAGERPRVAPRPSLVRALGRRERVVLVDADPRVDRLRIAVEAVGAVAIADAGEAGLDELARGQDPFRQQPDGVEDAEVGGVGQRAEMYSVR
jgi:hypothetical protein